MSNTWPIKMNSPAATTCRGESSGKTEAYGMWRRQCYALIRSFVFTTFGGIY